MEKTKIVILGAGYGGLITSRELEKKLSGNDAEVTLINKHEYHYIASQLHKIGAGTKSDDQIVLRIKDLFKTDKVKFKRATVSNVDFKEKQVILTNGETVKYDYLLISLGFDVDTFGIPGVEENAFKIRSYRSSKEIYNHILNQFIAYKKDRDPSRLTFVVGGAGFTGVEMVGELIEQIPRLCKEYNVPFDQTKIINIEAADAVLPFFDEKLIDYTERYFRKHGVEILTSTKVVECTADSITLDNGKVIPTRTFIWSGGVRSNRLVEKLNIPLIRNRIPVNEYLQVEGLKNVYCIGDMSFFKTGDNRGLPMTAQVAIQQAQACAKNLIAQIQGKELKPFVYDHKGSVASIGSRAAVGKVFGVKVTGLIGAFFKEVIEMRYLFILGGPSLIMKQMTRRTNSFEKSVSPNK